MNEMVPPFGEWGDRENDGHTTGQPEAVFPDAIWEPLGEAFRSLRTRVVQALGEEKNKVILVASAVPREGKTLVAANLARAMAEASWNTLLVDGDMRASNVQTLFGLQRGEGLSEILDQEKYSPKFIRRSTIPNLDILTAGTQTQKPAEILNKPFVRSVCEAMRHDYEYSIIDSAPTIPVTDALLLARHADGILLVVESKKTPREEVKKALEQYRDRTILGLVMNGMNHQAKYSYYSY